MNIFLPFHFFLFLLPAFRPCAGLINIIKTNSLHKTTETFRNVPNKLLKSTTANSIVPCSVQCLNTVCCTAFTFSPQTGACELMTPVRISSPLTTTTTAMPQQAPAIMQFAIEWLPKNCWEIQARYPTLTSGVYTIYVTALGGHLKPVDVWCDMASDGGGWTLILRRFDGSVNFYLDYADYIDFIGNAQGEHWIGLENMHAITSPEQYELRVDMESNSGTAWAKYQLFSVNGAADNFRLSVSGYDSSSTAGDGLTFHNGRKFSARDVPSDCGSPNYCGARHKGAWWYTCCFQAGSQFLSEYKTGPMSYDNGLQWMPYTGALYSLKRVEMNIRPLVRPTQGC